MATTLTNKVAHMLLSQLQKEREARLKTELEAEKKRLEEEEEQAKRALFVVEEKKEALAQKAKRDQEQLKAQQRTIEQAARNAADEHALFALQQRMHELRGNDNDSLQERLRLEGYNESLVRELLRVRTLEQSMEVPGGLTARFTHWEQTTARTETSAALYQQEQQRILYEKTPSVYTTATATKPSTLLYGGKQL